MPSGSPLAPELGQLQFVPETTRKPAVAEDARALERQLGEFHLQAVERIGRDLAAGGEQRDLLGALRGLVERFGLFAPRGLPGVVNLAEIKDGALGRALIARKRRFSTMLQWR